MRSCGHLPALTAFVVADTAPLHHFVREVWRLARALPIEPMRVFEAQTRNLPRTDGGRTDGGSARRPGCVPRRADGILGRTLRVTGIREPRLLRASHIKPWAKCDTDDDRLDVYNGLLLAAHLDAAFDAGLISFSDDGVILLSYRFTQADREALGIHNGLALARVGIRHYPNLFWHRHNLFSSEAAWGDAPSGTGRM